MLTAKIRVRYEGNWTSQLEGYDVFGEFLASVFRDRRYFGLLALDVADGESDDVIETIRTHESTVSLDVVEARAVGGADRRSMTLLLRSQHFEYTPLQVLLQEGFIPLGGFGELRDGTERFDLLLRNRDDLAHAVELLERFGPTKVELISSGFQQSLIPSVTEWNELFESITPRQRRVLNEAIDAGYFDIPRNSTLEEIANELDIAKTTVSQHLRKSERNVMEFFVKYVNIQSKYE